MSLNDPNWISFGGDPITQRVAPQLVVHEPPGVKMTDAQFAGVSAVYSAFASSIHLSAYPKGSHAEGVELSDGTRVSMISVNGVHQIDVWPSGGGGERLAHGFAVATNWQATTIYKRDINDGIVWSFDGQYVPQVEAEDTSTFDNQVFRAADVGGVQFFCLPLVYRKDQSVLWDYAMRDGLASGSGTVTVPFALQIWSAIEPSFNPPHYAVEDKILDSDGNVLYTVPATANILAPTAMDYPDLPHYFPAQTDSSGSQLAMNHWRYAVISPTSNIWQFRLCNEIINRTDESAYAPAGRYVQDIITPWPAQTATTSYIADASTGEEIDDRLTAFSDGVALTGSGWFDPPGVNATFATGWGSAPLNISTVTRRGSFENSMRQILVQANAAYTKEKVLAVGAENSGSYIDILSELNYPANVFWRGATKATSYYRSDVYGSMYSNSGYGTSAITILRKDTKYHVDGLPKVTARLGWKDLVLLGGTTTGRMDGKVYSDTEGVHGSFYHSDKTFITAETYTGPPLYSFFTAHNIRNTTYQTLMDKYWTTAYGGPNPTTITTTVFNERPVNTVEYNLLSRYVIDYDHKGRFYAAIRCEVTCINAKWVEDVSVYEGYMKEDTPPSYTVKIWFESNWKGTEAQQLLVEETVTRPGFEIIPIEKFSPWYWPSLVFMDRSCVARVPPEPRPDENFMMMFQNLASHQGANTHIACADVRTDITDPDAYSLDGIEYSYLNDGSVTPHTRFVTGQLYARTFKLSDMTEALWLLHALKVDAIEGDFQPIDGPERLPWHYHPIIKAALDVVRHIEVRDGVIGNWSSELESSPIGYPPTSPDLPDPADRDIKLYRV